MKKRFLCMAALLSMAVCTPAVIYAEETTETVAEAVEATDAEAAEEAAEETAPAEITDIVIAMEEGEVTLTNASDKNFQAVYAKAEAEEAAEETWNLTLTDEEGSEVLFENVKPQEWTDASLVNEYGLYYIQYKDAAQADQEIAESCEEKTLEEKVTVYTSTVVNLRENPDTSATVIRVCAIGEEYSIIGAVPGWVKVELDGEKTGFISHKYVTEDKELVDQLIKEAEAAAAAAAQAKAAAAASSSSSSGSYSSSSSSSSSGSSSQSSAPAVYEVSRVKYDDCDGSGHGYYEITYSDGSVSYQDY